VAEAITLLTQTEDFQYARLVNTTDTSYPTIVPTASSPYLAGANDKGNGTSQTTHRAVYDKKNKGAAIQNVVKIIPFGTGSNTNTMNVLVIGWQADIPPNTTLNQYSKLYVPQTLAIFAVTMGATTGAAGCFATNLMVFMASATLTQGNANINNSIVGPGTPYIGNLLVDLQGCELVEILFNTNGSVTDCNALFCFY